MHKAGRALGVFHNNSTAPSESKTVYDDLADLDEYTVIIDKVKADLAVKYREVIELIMTKVDHFKNRNLPPVTARCAPISSSCREIGWQ